MAHAFNPGIYEAEVGRSLSSRPSWSTEWVLCYTQETLSQKSKQTKDVQIKSNQLSVSLLSHNNHNVTWRVMTWQGVLWRGVAWCGVAWQGMAWGGVWCDGSQQPWRVHGPSRMTVFVWFSFDPHPSLMEQKLMDPCFRSGRTEAQEVRCRAHESHK